MRTRPKQAASGMPFETAMRALDAERLRPDPDRQVLSKKLKLCAHGFAGLMPALESFVFEANLSARNKLRLRIGMERWSRFSELTQALQSEMARQVLLYEGVLTVPEKGPAHGDPDGNA